MIPRTLTRAANECSVCGDDNAQRWNGLKLCRVCIDLINAEHGVG